MESNLKLLLQSPVLADFGYCRMTLDAIDNHVVEAMPTGDEDLEIIFSEFH